MTDKPEETNGEIPGKNEISVRSDNAGATVTFKFDSENVPPTEALARLFAEAVYKLLQENPWPGGPPIGVAMAWSLSSVIAHAAQILSEKKDELSSSEFYDLILDTLENFYAQTPGAERVQRKARLN